MPRICILTGFHLCHNPRVIKEATALAGAGFDVAVFGAALSDKLKLRDEALGATSAYRFMPVIDLTGPQPTFSATKIGKLLHRVLRIENKWQLGEAYRALKKAALDTPADLYICHMEQGLAVGDELLRAGRRVAVDIEDWYSEDLPKRVRQRRPIKLLRRLERRLLSESTFALCPSRAMAERLADVYGCAPPAVIYNAFPWKDRQQLAPAPADSNRPKSIYWFSQTIGPGRGLEDLVSALPRLNYPVQIHLRGTLSYGFKERLTARMPHHWIDKVFFHDPVHNTELLSSIVEHHIGYAGEPQDSFNKDLTISNKIFHYMLGGLAVVASNTKGQTEVAANAKGGVRLYKVGSPASLAEQLNFLLSSPAKLRAAQEAALETARTNYCWEKEAAKLIALVKDRLRDCPN